jgi:hypothetical protein
MSVTIKHPTFGVKLSLMPYEEASEVHADPTTTLGELKQHVIASSDMLPPGTKTSDLKAWNDGGSPMVHDRWTMADYNVHPTSTILFGFDWPEDVRELLPYYMPRAV